MNYTILIADDEKEILEICEMFLTKEGFNVIKAQNGQEAINYFKNEKIDLVILDIMMPKITGIQVLEYIRKNSAVPVIFLTAKNQDYDKIIGLKSGADDDITKPFNPLELAARVEACLRRAYMFKTEHKEEVLKNGQITVYPKESKVMVLDKEIKLTATEYKLLKLFISHCGQVFTKKQIFEALREEEYLADDNVIMVHISNLRNKIKDDCKHPVYIKTIKGLGYKMNKVNLNNIN